VWCVYNVTRTSVDQLVVGSLAMAKQLIWGIKEEFLVGSSSHQASPSPSGRLYDARRFLLCTFKGVDDDFLHLNLCLRTCLIYRNTLMRVIIKQELFLNRLSLNLMETL